MTVRSDLQTNLTHATTGIDMGNVTGLSTRPKILIANREGSDTAGSKVSGVLNLIREIYRPEQKANIYRNDRYVITASFKIAGQAGDSKAIAILAEIRRVLDEYNDTVSHTYEYIFEYELAIDNGDGWFEYDCSFTMIEHLVATV